MNGGSDLVLAAGAASGAAVLGLTGLLRAAYRPRDPGRGEVVMDLGPEPPAVVDLLTDRFEVTAEAPVATLVDLAARRWIDIDEPAPDEVVVRLRSRPGHGELAPFERRVLQRVQQVAAHGPAPAGALVKGTERSARSWQRQFRDEVVAAARAAGLCRPRWPAGVLAAPFVAALLAGGGFYLGAPEEGERSAGFDRTTGLTFAAAAVTVVALVVGTAMVRRAAVRGTDAGLARASAWLGVRQFMADHGRFGEYPAASVRVWDRYLAHAVALDLAGLAARQLPLGAEDDRLAWSRRSGRWRMVKVRYPRWRPGWGWPAWQAGALGLAVTVAGPLIGRPVGAALLDVAGDLPTSFPDTAWVPWLSRIIVGAAPVAVAAWVVFGPVLLIGAAVDVTSRREVDGVVLRHRVARSNSDGHPSAYWVAIDTGEGERLRAYRVRTKLAAGLLQGMQVRASASRVLGHVAALRVTSLESTAVPSASPTAAPDAPSGGDPLATALWQRATQLARQHDTVDRSA